MAESGGIDLRRVLTARPNENHMIIAFTADYDSAVDFGALMDGFGSSISAFNVPVRCGGECTGVHQVRSLINECYSIRNIINTDSHFLPAALRCLLSDPLTIPLC
jgi:hypothetical protein